MNSDIIEKIADVLEAWSNGRLEQARINLEQNGIKRTSMLAQSLQDNGIEVTPDSISIEIKANEYYIYVDEGVKGLKNERSNSGRFSFKTPFPSTKMIENIRDWIPRKGVIKAMPKGKKQTISEADQAAIAIAFGVKQKGIKQTNFWSGTFNPKSYKNLAEEIEQALGGQFTINLQIS